jgi:hypothetical protein
MASSRSAVRKHRLAEAAHRHHLDEPVLDDHLESTCRALARVWSLVAVGVFIYLAMRIGAPRSTSYQPWEETASLVALTVTAIGLALAWKWEGLGGALALVAGIGLGALAALEYHPALALGAAALFLVPAVLFLLAWQRTRSLLSVMVLAIVTASVMVVGAGAAFAMYEAGFGPTHPESTVAALPDSAVDWIWAGGVTEDGATVVARVPGSGPTRLALSTTPDLSTPTFITADGGGSVYRFSIHGLEPDTRYHYAVEHTGDLDGERAGTFRTFPNGPFTFTVAFGSCARLGSNGAVFDTIRETEPDLYLILGDWYYADIHENSVEVFEKVYDKTLTQPSQAALYRSVPIAYTWDDHDYGPNDAAADSPSREAALASYRRLVPHYPLAFPGADDPITQAFTIGRVRFLLTDTRSARTPKTAADGPSKTMLGTDQLAWLERELLAADDEYPVIIWVNSVPWIADADPGADHWGGYAAEREHIAAFIADHDIDGVVMLAGDAHMLAIDDGTNSNFAPQGETAFPVMHAAALDRVGSEKGGPYSEGAFPGGGQYGSMIVHDDGGDEITVELIGRDWTGREITALTVPIEVQP